MQPSPLRGESVKMRVLESIVLNMPTFTQTASFILKCTKGILLTLLGKSACTVCLQDMWDVLPLFVSCGNFSFKVSHTHTLTTYLFFPISFHPPPPPPPPSDLLHRGLQRACPACHDPQPGCAARECWRTRERSLFSLSQRPAAAASGTRAGGPSHSQLQPKTSEGEEGRHRED